LSELSKRLEDLHCGELIQEPLDTRRGEWGVRQPRFERRIVNALGVEL
jgi:hypothetical protein